MPFKQTNVVVSGLVFVPPDPGDHIPDMGAHPEHPIYLPVPTPPDLGIWGPTDPRPTPPIFIPTLPPDLGGDPPLGIWGGSGSEFPTPPIYIPIPPPDDAHIEHPIYYPVQIWGPNDPRPTPPIELPPWAGTPPADLAQKLKDFLYGNLPPAAQPVVAG